MTSGAKAEGRFGKQDFVYMAEEDVYRCPAGEKLDLPLSATSENGSDAAPLLDRRLPSCPIKQQLHHRQGAPDHALGA